MPSSWAFSLEGDPDPPRISLFLLWLLSYEQALTELDAMSLESIQHELAMFLKSYLTGLGVDLPHGYTWKDLVSELSQGKTDKEYLLGILADMIKEGTRSEWTVKALQILDRRRRGP